MLLCRNSIRSVRWSDWDIFCWLRYIRWARFVLLSAFACNILYIVGVYPPASFLSLFALPISFYVRCFVPLCICCGTHSWIASDLDSLRSFVDLRVAAASLSNSVLISYWPLKLFTAIAVTGVGGRHADMLWRDTPGGLPFRVWNAGANVHDSNAQRVKSHFEVSSLLHELHPQCCTPAVHNLIPHSPKCGVITLIFQGIRLIRHFFAVCITMLAKRVRWIPTGKSYRTPRQTSASMWFKLCTWQSALAIDFKLSTKNSKCTSEQIPQTAESLVWPCHCMSAV